MVAHFIIILPINFYQIFLAIFLNRYFMFNHKLVYYQMINYRSIIETISFLNIYIKKIRLERVIYHILGRSIFNRVSVNTSIIILFTRERKN